MYENLCISCFEEKGNENSCPHCGYVESGGRKQTFLPAHCVLQERYLIGEVLSTDKNAVCYKALDMQQNRIVEVQEHFPRARCYRVGGDEFIILMPNTTEKEAEACIESARQLAAQMKLGDMPLSMSYGLSMLASKCDLTERAVEAADRRMYQEKRLHHAAND